MQEPKMAKLQWSETMSVGEISIDQQHKRLVAMANAAHHAITLDRDNDVIANIILRLARYTQEHFAHEERYMQQIGYPQLDQHRQVHLHLMEKVHHVKQKISSGQQFSPALLACFLKDWLMTHILKEDKDYAVFAATGVSEECSPAEAVST